MEQWNWLMLQWKKKKTIASMLYKSDVETCYYKHHKTDSDYYA